LEFQNRNGFEHSVNTIFAGHLIALGLAVEPAARRRPLRRRQVPRKGGHGAMASLAATEQISEGQRQHGGLLVAHALNIAAFGHLLMDGLPKTQQLLVGHLAGRIDLPLMLAECFGQLALAQLARRMFDNLPHVKLLGPVVGFIEILRHPFEAGTPAHLPPTRSFVGRAAKKLAVNETFSQDNRMPINLLPVLR
jgi:hypothetical protein